MKFLVAVTPNRAPCYVSPCYGGRATDKFIVKDCGFLNFVEPYDQIMADRGLKIKDELLMSNAYLCIPPSTKAGSQMVPREVKETSRIANVRIYYMGESVLLGTKPLVDSIRHFIRDPSGVFSVCHLCECRIVQ